MSKIKNGGLDQCAEPLEQQQFGTAGVEGLTKAEKRAELYDARVLCTQRFAGTVYANCVFWTSRQNFDVCGSWNRLIGGRVYLDPGVCVGASLSSPNHRLETRFPCPPAPVKRRNRIRQVSKQLWLYYSAPERLATGESMGHKCPTKFIVLP